MREYTLQYMQDYDWVRITAVYSAEQLEVVLSHANDLMLDGMIVRLLARDTNRSMTWYTVRLNGNNAIMLNNSTNCPQ